MEIIFLMTLGSWLIFLLIMSLGDTLEQRREAQASQKRRRLRRRMKRMRMRSLGAEAEVYRLHLDSDCACVMAPEVTRGHMMGAVTMRGPIYRGDGQTGPGHGPH